MISGIVFLSVILLITEKGERERHGGEFSLEQVALELRRPLTATSEDG
jgi:hypothetical protein